MAEGGGALAVEIGGIRLLAEPAGPGVVLGLNETMRRFRCPLERPDVTLRVRRAPQRDERSGRLVFRSGGLWELWERDGQHLFRFVSPRMGAIPYKTARFDAAFTRGEIELHDGYPAYGPAAGPLDPFEYPLDELICVHWLAQGRGVELHACGIVDGGGEGHIFVGHSGAGKTTLSGLWRGPGTILSDDRIIVRLEGERAFMYGTPWHGEARLSAQGRAPVKDIFLLEKAARTEVVALPQAAAAARLLACSFVPHHDPRALASSLEILGALVRGTRCAELRFHRASDLAEIGLRQS
jgi:hypothetical protein